MPRTLFTPYTQLHGDSTHSHAAFLLLLVACDSLLANQRYIFAALSCTYVLAMLMNNPRTRTHRGRRRRRHPPPPQLDHHGLTDIDNNRPLSDTGTNDHPIPDLPSPIRIPTPMAMARECSPPPPSTWDPPAPSSERFLNRPLYLGNPFDSAEHRMYRDRERRFHEHFTPRPPPPTDDGEWGHVALRNCHPYRRPEYQTPYADTVEDEDAFRWRAKEVENARGRKGRGDLWGKGW